MSGISRTRWTWLFWQVALVAGVTAPLSAMCDEGPPADLVARNLTREMLHTVDDYLADLPQDALSAEARRALKSAAEESLRDGVTNDGVAYFASYEFVVPGLVVMSSVHVLESEQAAQRAAMGLYAGAQKAVTDRGASRSELNIPAAYDFKGKMLVTKDQQGELIGNSFYLWRGRNVYQLTCAGAGAFVDAEDAAHFVASKANAMLDFRPDMGELSRGDARKSGDEDGNAGLTVGLLALYALAYFSGKGAFWLAARMRGRVPSSGRSAGVVTVLAVASGVFGYLLSALDRGSDRFQRLTPYQQGELEGMVVGTALTPALLVLAVVGIAALIARRKSFG